MRTPSFSPLLGARVIAVTVALSVATVPFAAAAQAAITKPFTPGKTVALAPGITFQKGTARTTGGRRQAIRVAMVEPQHPSVLLKSVLSNDKVVRRDLVSKMATKKSKPGQQAMVATNGDMSTRNRFDAYAAPQSMAVSNGELQVAQACTRPTLGIDADGKAHIGNVRAHVTVTLPGRPQSWKQIHRVNTHRDDGHVVLYTKRFASSTQTAGGGIEVVLELEDTLRPNGVQTVKVIKVRRGAGNTTLESGKAVLSVNNPKVKWVYNLKVGDRMPLTTEVVRKVNDRCGGIIETAGQFTEIVEAVGGNHFTARNGKVAAPSKSAYPAGSQRHPRTNVGVAPDGRVIMVTVDGRRPGAAGMTLADMGRLMLSFGARHSFNLDGGGSTAMARYMASSGEIKVANKPSDGQQRPATQALVAFEFDATP